MPAKVLALAAVIAVVAPLGAARAVDPTATLSPLPTSTNASTDELHDKMTRACGANPDSVTGNQMLTQYCKASNFAYQGLSLQEQMAKSWSDTANKCQPDCSGIGGNIEDTACLTGGDCEEAAATASTVENDRTKKLNGVLTQYGGTPDSTDETLDQQLASSKHYFYCASYCQNYNYATQHRDLHANEANKYRDTLASNVQQAAVLAGLAPGVGATTTTAAGGGGASMADSSASPSAGGPGGKGGAGGDASGKGGIGSFTFADNSQNATTTGVAATAPGSSTAANDSQSLSPSLRAPGSDDAIVDAPRDGKGGAAGGHGDGKGDGKNGDASRRIASAREDGTDPIGDALAGISVNPALNIFEIVSNRYGAVAKKQQIPSP